MRSGSSPVNPVNKVNKVTHDAVPILGKTVIVPR
jgi:hypothetical protein